MSATLVERGLDGVLLRYRVMAWITGTILVIMSCVGLPLEYVGGNEAIANGWTVHGFLYIVYLIMAFEIVRRMRWRLLPSLAVLLAGTIPFLTFVVEHWVTTRVRAAQSDAAPPPAQRGAAPAAE